MEYNTRLKQLTLPEYGRNIHNMVEYCMTLESKEERTKCAYTIVNIMGNMFPHLRDVNDFKHILWDHIAIMSDFQLDIDYPYDVVKKEDLQIKPERLHYSRPDMRFKHYGKTLENMLNVIPTLETQEEKDQLIMLLAIQMKKSYLQWNKEVDDQKIFEDLYMLSEGTIDIRDKNIKLPAAKELNINKNNSNNNNNNHRRKKK